MGCAEVGGEGEAVGEDVDGYYCADSKGFRGLWRVLVGCWRSGRTEMYHYGA